MELERMNISKEESGTPTLHGYMLIALLLWTYAL